MSSSKGGAKSSKATKEFLKASKEALQAKNYDDAVSKANEALELEPDSFFALSFLGRAQHMLGKWDDAEKAYVRAAKLKPDDETPWVGLKGLYEDQGGKKIDEYVDTTVKLAQLYQEADKIEKCQDIVNKSLAFVKKNGTQRQYVQALKVQLPNSPLYDYLEGRIPNPAHTYTRLIEMTEEDEKQTINRLISERRTRIGANKTQVTADVKREIFGASELVEYYTGLIDWTSDDEIRRTYEEKKLQRTYDHLLVVGKDRKKELREQVLDTTRGMVIIKHPYQLAWDIELEWKSVENIKDLDISIIRQYIEFFPQAGLTKVLQGYINSPISPFPAQEPTPVPASDLDDSDDDDEGGVPLEDPEDLLLNMNDGLQEAKSSPLAHRLMAEYFLHLEEFESAVETTRPAIDLCQVEAKKSGLKLQDNLDALNNILATALITYQTPRNHPEAKRLFEDILDRKPNFTPALLGTGLILVEEESYAGAQEYLSKALKRDPNNVRVGIEASWCKALNGNLAGGLADLESYIEKLDPKNDTLKDLRAETLYRIGRCQWELDDSKSARKDRKGPYVNFLAAIKTNISFAPAYTSLGLYYADYARDQKRARQCFQKAFDLSASEILAAERLARAFADKGDWDVVEVIAQRVVDSGKARPPPGSTKKGISWPYSALGVVQMNRLEYQKAVVSFLAALRISPGDYHSYVGLGEAYHNSGRYNSALKTFTYAENPGDEVHMKKSSEDWFTKYMLANVSRELGSYEEAIELYSKVLKSRKEECGVEIALMQTHLEYAWRSIELGFFGRAVDHAVRSLDVATNIVQHKPEAFNLWKGVADACSVFATVQDRIHLAAEQATKIKTLLRTSFDAKHWAEFESLDGIGASSLETLDVLECDETDSHGAYLHVAVTGSILASKRALHYASADKHAQAVAWYNLGWASLRAHSTLEQRPSPSGTTASKSKRKFLKSALRAFKRAIELESGNADFWTALGTATAPLNAPVAQHALVRALHLNERNPRAWANLGALYLAQGDVALAHEAFARAQSADPDYAGAWVGEGIVARLAGHQAEALLHFGHAVEIADAASKIVKRELPAAAFAALAAGTAAQKGVRDDVSVIQPLFALQQLRALTGADVAFDHLAALYHERIGNYGAAVRALEEVCGALEAAYEEDEDNSTLLRFAQAKADLARNLLGAREFEKVVEEVGIIFDLITDDEDDGLDKDAKRTILLSARLADGLARYYTTDTDGALAAFRSALAETDAHPDVVCALAEVLWAKGGDDERTVAKEQLFEAIGRGTGHVDSVLLLGVMAAVQGDDEGTLAAVREELEPMRARDDLSTRQLDRVERVLEAMRELSTADDDGDADAAALAEVQKSIVLAPHAVRGWLNLAELSDQGNAAEMALATARRSAPPGGQLSSAQLAGVFARTGTAGDAQMAVMLSPARAEGWKALAGAVA